MRPSFPNGDRTLALDDRIAISSLYDTFGVLTGSATDIAVGANGAIGITSREAFGDGFRVKKWNGSGWTNTDGGATASRSRRTASRGS